MKAETRARRAGLRVKLALTRPTTKEFQMISPSFFYWSTDTAPKTEHSIWIHDDLALLTTLRAMLAGRFNSQYPKFVFIVHDNSGVPNTPHALGVQVHLGGEEKQYRPGEYSSDFNRFFDFCTGFEIGWTTMKGQR